MPFKPITRVELSRKQKAFWEKYLKKNIYKPHKRIEIGNIYVYPYEAKTYNNGKGPLKYYDAYPLVMVIGKYTDGWLGLSLHYLPTNVRMYFIKKILILNKRRLNNGLTALVPYSMISNMANAWLREGYVIIKRYLTRQIRGTPAKIDWKEWYNLAGHNDENSWINISAAEAYRDTRAKLQNVRRAATQGTRYKSTYQKRGSHPLKEKNHRIYGRKK